MIKGGSLFYAVLISLIIALVTSALLLFSYTTRNVIGKFDGEEKLRQNAKSGINFLLSDQQIIPLNSTNTRDLFGQEEDSVTLSFYNWGIYRLLSSRSYYRNKSQTLTALSGAKFKERFCLYLADQNKPLAISGKTLLKGDAFLPKSGIVSTNVEGQSYIGKTLISGRIRNSKKLVPEFDKSLSEEIKALLKNKQESDSIIDINGSLNDSVCNSFLNKTLTLLSPSTLHIHGYYKGRILIRSEKSIEIHAEAFLEDVMIIAPKIFIKKGFKGTLQAFASDSIIIEENVSLNYPSGLGIIQLSPITKPSILIASNDTILGEIFLLGIISSKTISSILISKNTLIEGRIYTNGSANIQGRINGSLTCQNILLTTSSTTYENHLLNSVIDANALSEHYVSSAKKEETNVIVKYLR